LGALPAIEATLEAGRGSARALLEELRVDRLRLTGAPGDAKVAHSEAPLLNVNTPDDLEAALRFVATEGEG
jgi:molybdopterin-guanine dinucleotide biosynthesis protein A